MPIDGKGFGFVSLDDEEDIPKTILSKVANELNTYMAKLEKTFIALGSAAHPMVLQVCSVCCAGSLLVGLVRSRAKYVVTHSTLLSYSRDQITESCPTRSYYLSSTGKKVWKEGSVFTEVPSCPITPPTFPICSLSWTRYSEWTGPVVVREQIGLSSHFLFSSRMVASETHRGLLRSAISYNDKLYKSHHGTVVQSVGLCSMYVRASRTRLQWSKMHTVYLGSLQSGQEMEMTRSPV